MSRSVCSSSESWLLTTLIADGATFPVRSCPALFLFFKIFEGTGCFPRGRHSPPKEINPFLPPPVFFLPSNSRPPPWSLTGVRIMGCWSAYLPPMATPRSPPLPTSPEEHQPITHITFIQKRWSLLSLVSGFFFFLIAYHLSLPYRT